MAPVHAPPTGFRARLFSLLGLCFVLIMVALDQTVVGTALPTVVAELHGFDLYAWVGTSYLLTSVITVPIFGRLGDEYGRKNFILVAIVLFTLASMLCGLSQSMLQLVLARALQGIGGGMLVATTFASVPDLFPDPHERLRWQVLFSSSFGLANAIGPSLGGFLTEYAGWRWVFYVNLPVGLVSLWFVWRYLPRIRHSEHPPGKLDWLGAALLALALGSVQLLVEWLPQHRALGQLLTPGVVAVVATAGLLWWEKRCPHPILPLDMFRHASLAPLFALSLVMGFCMFAIMYYAPLMFQGGFGLSPNQAGLLITPFVVCITVGSILNGRIVTRLPKPNLILYVGFVFFALSAFGLTQTVVSTGHPLLVATMMSGGIGVGLLLPNLTIFAQETAPRTQLGIATAMLQSTRMIGGMLGTALIGTFVSHHYASGVADALQAAQAGQWTRALQDPQILVNPDSAAKFIAQAGSAAAPLLQAAREVLVEAIHGGQYVVLAMMLVALFLVTRVPDIKLKRRSVTKPVAPAAQGAE
ncbi:Multidrug resistance protein 3 [Amantichitinum ursilacus]|uniref:Multidrug resistance protein 3 n=1 Tax=Amantichitinum ursilacus TaxID=857265 RepID=A0A0N0GNQ5_9NEIS|nr:Multidrug resistance protein 3 [Amantichitinum ursilacus]